MWRRLVGRAHPDAGGDNDLFIWTMATRDAICSGALAFGIPSPANASRSRQGEPSTPSTGSQGYARVPFDPFADFEVLTSRALAMAAAVAEPYGYLLRRLADCYPVSEGPLRVMQTQGATYRTLARIGHQVGMSKQERVEWYRICETIPLSQRHAGHILSHLQRKAA